MVKQSAPSKSASHRSPELDCAKGIAILAVVLSHALRGVAKDGLVPENFAYIFTDDFFYLFHVQLFLLISGYLSFAKAADKRYQFRRQISLFYIYILWSAISLTILTYVGRPPTQDPLPYAYLTLLYAPIQHFWFLPTIMIGDILLYFLRSRLALLAVMAFCLAFRLIFNFSYYALDYYLFFVLLGAFLRGWPIAWNWQGSTWLYVSIAFLLGCTGAAYIQIGPTSMACIPITILGCYAAFQLAKTIAQQPRVSPALSYLGKISLPIFLTHAICMSASRKVCIMLLGTNWPATTMMISFAIALGFPIAIYIAAKRLGFTKALGFQPLLS